MRKVAYGVVCLLVALGLAAIASVFYVHHAHPRNRDAYLAYVKQHGIGKGPIILPPHGQVVAEGDKACHWLGAQPMAYWRHGAKYQYPAVMARYREHVRGQFLAWGLLPPSHHAVAVAAWKLLCPANWELHKPL